MSTESPSISVSEMREKFFKMINAKNYSHSYLYYYEIRFNALEKFMKNEGMKRYTPQVGHDFFQKFINGREVGKSTKLSLKCFIFKLNDIAEGKEIQSTHNSFPKSPPVGFENILYDFASYCLENGNKYSTVNYKIYNCTEFCRFLNTLDCCSIEQLDETKIVQSCLANASNNRWRCIRLFLLFLYETGHCQKDYSYLVPKEIKKEPFPSIYSDEEILQMEMAVDRLSKAGKRDICILLLESRLTMRSGDIVNLTFDNVEFENNRITFFQEKTGKPVDLPLLPEIKSALEEYIETARPESDDNHIFLRINAPFIRLTTAALRNISKKYIQKSGIDTAGRRSGPHSRRASAASSMINSGVSYDAVKRILGHADPNAIRHYASLDKNNLRRCALQSPPPTGVLKELLEGRCAL